MLPIVVDYEDKKTGEHKVGVHGTGTLFKFFDKHFLITAAHVLLATEGYDDNIGIPAGKNSKRALRLYDCTRYCPENKELGNIYDIGVIKLSDIIGELLEKSYQFLNEQNIQFKINRNMYIYVAGFPNILGTFDETENTFNSTTWNFMSKHKIPEREYSEFDPKAHILVEYRKKYYEGGDEDKLVTAEQDLRGISGCSLWAFEDNQSIVWSAEKCLKVIGIQSGVMEAEYLKGTKWVYMIDAFKHIDQDIFDLLSECKKKQMENEAIKN